MNQLITIVIAQMSWLMYALLASVYKASLFWKKKEKFSIKLFDTLLSTLHGVIVGYFVNKILKINDLEKYAPVIVGVAAFLGTYIGMLLIKNRWLILKKQTGLNGDDKAIEE